MHCPFRQSHYLNVAPTCRRTPTEALIPKIPTFVPTPTASSHPPPDPPARRVAHGCLVLVPARNARAGPFPLLLGHAIHLASPSLSKSPLHPVLSLPSSPADLHSLSASSAYHLRSASPQGSTPPPPLLLFSGLLGRRPLPYVRGFMACAHAVAGPPPAGVDACKPVAAPAAASRACHTGYDSPLAAATAGGRETLLYVPAVLHREHKRHAASGDDGGGDQGTTGVNGDGGKAAHPDYLATVDVDPDSPTYATVIHRLPMLAPGDELHHMGWSSCSSCRSSSKGIPPGGTHTTLVAGGVLSGDIHFIDVAANPRAPALAGTVTAAEIASSAGLSWPHTSHCTPDAVVVSCMAGVDGDPAGNGFLSIDPATRRVLGRWEAPGEGTPHGYDFWYQPRHDVMVSSGWGTPSQLVRGFNPAHVATGGYGRTLTFWSWSRRVITGSVDLGAGSVPLEVRFLHNPDEPVGYVACALSGELVRFVKDPSAAAGWSTSVVLTIPSVAVTGWLLPSMPALITDFVISLDDRYLFLACWLHGDVRQYDIRDTAHPRLVGQVYIGGLLSAPKDTGVTLADAAAAAADGIVPPATPTVVGGVRVRGGAQMVQLSRDGRRLYVSTSLFSAWDAQFYPDLVARGGQLLRVDVDVDAGGGLSLAEDFVVDFGAEPWGPALAHEMRLPGGDCTSDIWT